MRILIRYCLREELKLFGAALFFFSGLLLLGQVINMLRMVLNQGIPLFRVLSVVLLWFPTGVSYAIPMSLLFAVLIGYGQMAQEEELTAIRAAGVAPAQLLSPALMLGVMLSVALFVNEAWVAPPARVLFRSNLSEVQKDVRIETLITPGQLFTGGDIKFSCQNILPGGKPVFQDVFFEYAGSPSFRIMAKTAYIDRISPPAKFVFEEGQIYWSEAEKHLAVQFDTAQHVLPTVHGGVTTIRAKDKGILALRPSVGQDPKDVFEFNKKSSLVLAPFFFAWFAATLSMLIKRGNRVLGFILTLSILTAYYILVAMASALQPTAPDLAALLVWGPDFLLLVLGYFFYRLIFVI